MLRLNLAPGVGPLTFRKLIDVFEEPSAIFEAGRAGLARVEGVGPKTADAVLSVTDEQVDAELKEADRHEVRVIPFGDEAYPEPLRHIPDPPLVLYVRGEPAEGDALAIAMVGSRRATLYGRKQARRLASGLASCGVTVVSGMARGIDTEAHEGALAAGGRTLAVLGTGLGVVYPPENAELYMQIVGSGAVLSEFPMNFPTAAGNFPRRNRIISGLSLGVIVVEARSRSGALITARHAMEQDREVFAVPGPVDAAGSRGPHRLLRDGACLVESPSDVLEHLGPTAARVTVAPMGGVSRPGVLQLNDRERAVYGALEGAPKTVDEVLEACGLGVSELTGALTVLEMRNLVRRLPGPRYART
jgi:DNA processing protein